MIQINWSELKYNNNYYVPQILAWYLFGDEDFIKKQMYSRGVECEFTELGENNFIIKFFKI